MSRGGARRGIFDGLPIPADKSYLKEGLRRIDEGWAAARFDSLPHVVHILTSKDREGEIQFLKEQSDLIEDVVDEVVHAYHPRLQQGHPETTHRSGPILRLFSESAESITGLKGEMADAKKLLGRKNKHLGQLWYRSLTLRHVLSLLDQVEDVAKVPARIENLMSEKQLYAAVQLHVQSMLMLEREGLQAVVWLQTNCSVYHVFGIYSSFSIAILKSDKILKVGALQDVRSDLIKLRGVLFYKILEELQSHLYNNGEYSSSFDGPDDENNFDMRESDGRSRKDSKSISREIPIFLSSATPDEFLESMTKADAPVNVKYLRTLVQCLSMLGKVAAAGAVIWTTSVDKSNLGIRKIACRLQYLMRTNVCALPFMMLSLQKSNPTVKKFLGLSENHIIVGELLEQKASSEVDNINTPHTANGDGSWNPDSESSQATGGFSVAFSLSVVQSECQQLLCEILRATPEAATADAAVQTARLANKDPVKEKRQRVVKVVGGTSLFPILMKRNYFDWSLHEVKLGARNFCGVHGGGSRDHGGGGVHGGNSGGHGGSSGGHGCRGRGGGGARARGQIPSGGAPICGGCGQIYGGCGQIGCGDGPGRRQRLGNGGGAGGSRGGSGWRGGGQSGGLGGREGREGGGRWGSAAGHGGGGRWNDGLLAFVNNFLKEHFLPAIFVDYRKCVQQAISSNLLLCFGLACNYDRFDYSVFLAGPAAFRPRVHATSVYSSSVELGRPVLQGLLAVDIIAKEVVHDKNNVGFCY
ncbi:hypothetical protein PR202_ga20707 [Eleusine coracana subsp. coracana]|uniref:Exocyst complex component Sec8 n=1 Tax=Eleusine coracana subsp. coracana TaxID=191504 RepID=A0AAV5CY34_ELECO|nr:hypothetical protein PR202_ga20707 [Eleusine coracana subsp. coracana]